MPDLATTPDRTATTAAPRLRVAVGRVQHHRHRTLILRATGSTVSVTVLPAVPR
ncbi:hypothetical protein [Streptomyces erythrochromogenes]|uniref:hypothetical protein n=1 Tax=Streptomyces erythrochromogenes TaxID=285574 RepID=UPI0033E92DB0